MFLRVLLCLLPCAPVLADSVVPTRTIRAHAIIVEADVVLRPGTDGTGFARVADVVGQEARVVLYPGRPVMLDDVGRRPLSPATRSSAWPMPSAGFRSSPKAARWNVVPSATRFAS